MNTELNELEFEVRTIVTDQPWTIYFSAEGEVSGNREEPTLEFIDYGSVRFIPKCAEKRDDWEQFVCEFLKFDTLYEIFRKDDLDKVKNRVESDMIERHFDGLDDWHYELQRDSMD